MINFVFFFLHKLKQFFFVIILLVIEVIKLKKRKLRRIKRLRNLVYITLTIIMITGLATTSVRVLGSYKEFQNIEATHQELLTQKDEMKKEVELLKNDDYIVHYARENYIFTYENEKVSALPESPQNNDTE